MYRFFSTDSKKKKKLILIKNIMRETVLGMQLPITKYSLTRQNIWIICYDLIEYIRKHAISITTISHYPYIY